MFTHWVIVFFGQFFSLQRKPKYLLIFTGKKYLLGLAKNGVGYILWSPCFQATRKLPFENEIIRCLLRAEVSLYNYRLTVKKLWVKKVFVSGEVEKNSG
jgi:hypothetical protein